MHLFRKFLGAPLVASIAMMAIAAWATPAMAQNYNYGGPGVANVSVANGGVVIVRGDSGAQVAATINAPLVPGDYIATSSGSDAEVQFDGASMLRLANNTQVRIVNLSPGSREVQLAAGTVDLAQLQGGSSAQIDTPQLTVRPNQNGDYRVSVLGNGETLVTVRSGAATVASANGSQTLTPGSTLVANGSYISMQNAVGFDSFDQFNNSRDQAVASAYNSNPYLSPQLAGYSNLSNYGQWQNVPGYGYSWAPNNQSQNNFAPYSNGQYVWEPGYGYTWVDNSPYGYTTSHYGTWFNNQNYGGWNWQPPAYQYQNSSASLASAFLPAVVQFFLNGSNGSSVGGLGNILGGLTGLLGNSSNANIGWIPLAPGEPYQPWYGQNYTYPTTILTNVTNTTNLYGTYSNARYYGGVTMIPVSAWRIGNFQRRVVVRPTALRRIVLIRGAVPVVPTTSNLHYTVRTVNRPIVLSRTFAARRLAARAPVVSRTSFATQQARIRSIASVRPKVVVLPARPVRIAHPVYHYTAHAPVHVMVIKPVARPVTHRIAPVAKPVTRKAAPVAKPLAHKAAAPVAKPVTHRAAPVTRPVTRPAPMAKPVTRQAAPVAKPVTRPAPVARPVTHPAAPVAKPAAKPAAHPEGKPAGHPHPKPTPGTL